MLKALMLSWAVSDHVMISFRDAVQLVTLNSTLAVSEYLTFKIGVRNTWLEGVPGSVLVWSVYVVDSVSELSLFRLALRLAFIRSF
jgi:hypothetical protein